MCRLQVLLCSVWTPQQVSKAWLGFACVLVRDVCHRCSGTLAPFAVHVMVCAWHRRCVHVVALLLICCGGTALPFCSCYWRGFAYAVVFHAPSHVALASVPWLFA
jgi:hypothetical protein